MFTPREVNTLYICRRIEANRVVVGVADDVVVDPAGTVSTLHRKRDVALAAGERLRRGLEQTKQRLCLDRLLKRVPFVVVKVQRRVCYVCDFTSRERHCCASSCQEARLILASAITTASFILRGSWLGVPVATWMLDGVLRVGRSCGCNRPKVALASSYAACVSATASCGLRGIPRSCSSPCA